MSESDQSASNTGAGPAGGSGDDRGNGRGGGRGGRGGGQSRGGGLYKNLKKGDKNGNYIGAGMTQLKEMFGSKADDATIKKVFDGNQHDMWKAIQELHTVTGLTPAGSGLPGAEGKQDEKEVDIQSITGDLFSCGDDEALAHCVSRCLAMGKGIATLFKSKFGQVDTLKAQDKQIGEVAVIKHQKRFVYYLITKERYFHKPTYKSVQASLVDMAKHAAANGVKVICMPRIGCGLDGLLWPQVKAIIAEVFKDTGITIKVYTL